MSSSYVFDLEKITLKTFAPHCVYYTAICFGSFKSLSSGTVHCLQKDYHTHNTINVHNSTLQYYTWYNGRYKYHDGMSQLHKIFYCCCLRYDSCNNNSALLVISNLKCEIQLNYASNAFTSSQKTLRCYGSKDFSSKGLKSLEFLGRNVPN
jgi:hypothetical protein